MLRDLLRGEGKLVGRKRIMILLRKTGIEALYCKANTRQRHARHPIYFYLLRDLKIDRHDQVSLSCAVRFR